MAGFDDLIPAAMPYLATEQLKGTAGRTWEWGYQLTDSAGAPIDLTTGYTLTGAIVTSSTRTSVATITVTAPSPGLVWCKLAPSTTVSVQAGRYVHQVKIVRTADSAAIDLVGGGDSSFTVLRAVA